MKRVLFISGIIISFCFGESWHGAFLFAQGTWAPKTPFAGGGRDQAAGFSIGTKGYIGTGYNSSALWYKDFWAWDQGTNAWTQISDFTATTAFGAVGAPGTGPYINNGIGFSIGNYGYVGTGQDGINRKAFWEYDPANNWWTRKTDFPGAGRYAAVGFSIGTKGYIGTGWIGGAGAKDFYEFDPADASLGNDVHGRPMGKWTQKKDFADVGAGGINRSGAAAFSIGNKGYVGMGQNADFPNACLNDWYEFDPVANTWTAKAAVPVVMYEWSVGFSIGNFGYIGTGTNCAAGSAYSTFYQYDPVLDTWTAKAGYPPGGRWKAVGFSIGCKGYIGTGNNGFSNFDGTDERKEFYEYSPDASNPCTPPLPIELLSFSAICDQNVITLNWSTATETNNNYFTVERSTDGNLWEAIGSVDGAGNSSTPRNYEFIDGSASLTTGTQIYYRLRQTDFNGKYEYFDPVAVESCADFAVFPNPAENELSVQFFSEAEDAITIEVYDVFWKLVVRKTSPVIKGNNLITLDISSAAGGVYMLQAKTTKSVWNRHQKFIKLNNKMG